MGYKAYSYECYYIWLELIGDKEGIDYEGSGDVYNGSGIEYVGDDVKDALIYYNYLIGVFYGRVNGSDEIGRLDVFMFLLDEDWYEDCDYKDCYKDYDYEDDNYCLFYFYSFSFYYFNDLSNYYIY